MDNPQKHFDKLFQKQVELTKRIEQYQYWKHPKVLEFIKKSNELISDLDNQISIEVQKEIEYQNFIKERQRVQDSIKNPKSDDTLYSFEIEKLNLDNKSQANSQQNETNHSMQQSNQILKNVLPSQKNSHLEFSNQKQVPLNEQQLAHSNNTNFYSENQQSMLQKQQQSQFNDKQEQNQMRSSQNKQPQQQNQQQNQFVSNYNQQQYYEQPKQDEQGQSLYYSIPPNNNQQDYQQEFQQQQLKYQQQSKDEKNSNFGYQEEKYQQQIQQEQEQLKSKQSQQSQQQYISQQQQQQQQQQYISQQQQKQKQQYEYKIDSEIDQFQEITYKKDENKSVNSIKQQNSLDSKGSPNKKSTFDKQKEYQEYLIKQQNDLNAVKKEKQQNNNQILKAQYQNQQYEASITLDQNKQSEVLNEQNFNQYQQTLYPPLSPLPNQKKIIIQEISNSNSKQSKNRQSMQQQKIQYQYQVDQETYMKMQEHQKQIGFTIINDKVYEEDGNEDKCSICLNEFFTDQIIQESYTIQLNCKHKFHYDCLMPVIKESFVKCPNCNNIIGQQIGDQPNGTMETRIIQRNCSSYNCNTIEIKYDFPSGKRNGVYYTGANRVAYLPNNQEGKKVLELLRKAFQQKLTFTVGRSVTTGRDNCVIWNGIHHKTCLDGGPTGFGYPDPTYFERVTQELKQKGIV